MFTYDSDRRDGNPLWDVVLAAFIAGAIFLAGWGFVAGLYTIGRYGFDWAFGSPVNSLAFLLLVQIGALTAAMALKESKNIFLFGGLALWGYIQVLSNGVTKSSPPLPDWALVIYLLMAFLLLLARERQKAALRRVVETRVG